MARFCVMCDEKLGVFYRKEYCKTCMNKDFTKWQSLIRSPKQLEKYSQTQIQEIISFGKKPIQKLYVALLNDYESDNQIDDLELETLGELQRLFDLTDREAHKHDVIFPYRIKNSIKVANHLPIVDAHRFEKINLNFKKNEDGYFVSATHLYEIKSVQVGYRRGSRGVSLYGFRFGNYRGHAIKENKLVKKSEGNLVMTDKNLYYLPNNGQRIVLSK